MPSTAITWTVLPALPVPAGVSASPSGSTIRLTWNNFTAAQLVDAVAVRWRTTAGSFGAWQTFGLGTDDGAGHSYGDITGLAPNTAYVWELAAAREEL